MPSTLTIDGRRLDPAPPGSLFDAATQAGVRVPTSCVTQGKCRECIVEVSSGLSALSPRTAPEQHLRDPFRLACQCHIVTADADVVCHTMRRGAMRIERHALALPSRRRAATHDPAVTRDGDWVLLDDAPLVRAPGPLHGLALDLGTTTVVLRLLNLETGEIIADASFENPQRFGGSDVMSRIHYDTSHPGRLLMRTVAGYLTHAIEDFPVDPHTIYEMVVVGNSTMRDLFFRQSVYPIGQTPYRSITEIEREQGRRTTTTLTQTGRRALLPIHPAARVYGGPIISGHVGADAAACLLAVDMADDDRLIAVMDIGTNTELLLGNRHRILAASCPAGPAFEGGAIRCGMPGLEGAIERVHVADNGEMTFDVIGHRAPEGICGSGLVDLLGELRRTGRMNALGRFENGEDTIRLEAERGIVFSEADVNELAQAKGANVAGLQIVFQQYGARFEDVDVFYLAGGFGRHLCPEAARRIGLIPDLPDDRIVSIGNAAIEGASLALLSMTARRSLEATVDRVEHCRLETHPDFFDYFVDGCQFAPLRSTATETS